MAVKRVEIIAKCDEWLQPEKFSDYAPNGLQVEGAETIGLIVTGVTACQALIDEAVRLGADAVMVHHGYFWKGEGSCLVGVKYNRISRLIKNDINLIAYHLPLDAHPVLGNNAQLADELGLAGREPVDGTGSPAIVMQGVLESATSGVELALKLEHLLGRRPLHIDSGRPIRRLAWCTGGGQGYIDQAIDAGVDAYITGEASEQTVHIARERGIHFFAAGHHATERAGIKALGEALAREFSLEVVFVDIDNPV